MNVFFKLFAFSNTYVDQYCPSLRRTRGGRKKYCKIMEIEIAKIEAQIKIHEMNSQ